MELALLPRHRGRGVGTRLLRELLAEAAAAGLPVRVHVERTNPALLLYSRLGFTPIAERAPYLQLEWRAAAEPAAPDPAQEA